MRKALFLIAIGAIYRLVPHPWNLVPIGALSLYAGASLPRRWAWAVPVAAMGLSDLVIDYAIGRPFLDLSRWIIYASFALTTLMGPLARRPKVGPWLLPVLSLSASALFFLTSNFGASPDCSPATSPRFRSSTRRSWPTWRAPPSCLDRKRSSSEPIACCRRVGRRSSRSKALRLPETDQRGTVARERPIGR